MNLNTNTFNVQLCSIVEIHIFVHFWAKECRLHLFVWAKPQPNCARRDTVMEIWRRKLISVFPCVWMTRWLIANSVDFLVFSKNIWQITKIFPAHLTAGHEAGGDGLAPAAGHLADRDLGVGHLDVARVAVELYHPPGPCIDSGIIYLQSTVYCLLIRLCR